MELKDLNDFCPLQADRHDIYTKVSAFREWMEQIILENGGLEACGGYVIESGFIVDNGDGFQDGEEVTLISLSTLTFRSDDSMNTVLLTGGSSGSDILSTTTLVDINGPVSNCAPPDLPEPRKNHVTFVTKDQPPKLATCGGSTNPSG